MENKDILSAQRTIDKEIEALNMMRNNFDEKLTAALDLLQNIQGRVIVTGMGKSGHIGKKIAATLASTGTPSFFVHPAEASHGDLGMLTNKDCVLAISNGGESRELSDTIVYCKRYGIPLIAMTKNPNSSLGKAGDYLLQLPDDGEACPLGLAPTSSTTATAVLGDVLAICLIERKGFSKVDFKQRHPGGKLGSILQKVSDVMHSGNAMPLISSRADMQEALLEMTSKRLGSVGIVDENNHLLGIITDGDLRRFLLANVMNKKAIELMTQNPKTISPDALIAEAINIMNTKKITQLFAVDKDNTPLGIIHMHDCLQAGVA